MVTVIICIVLGVLSSLGVGGGSLLMLWLTFACNYDFLSARFINLSFFLPAAFLSCCFQYKQLRHTLRYIIPAAISGCLCAFCFSHLSQDWDTLPIRRGYGVFLLITAFRELRISFQKNVPR